MGRNVNAVPNDDPTRLARVLDAKLRTIGIDKQALDAQVAEKKAREEDEKNAAMQYTRLAAYFADQVQLKQQEAAMLRKEMERDDMTFRTDRQGKQTTREWDLNDPDRLKHDAPARTCDDPSAAPVSGMQMFDGEDLGAGDRSKAQMAQNNDWWEQQLAEKEAIRNADREEERRYAALLAAQEALQQDCVAQEKTLRRELGTEQQELNKELAAKRRQGEEKMKREVEAMNSREQFYQATSPFLTEDPAAATSSVSGTRFRPDHFKGYGPGVAAEVTEYQKRQVAEKLAREAQEKDDEVAYARYMRAVGKAVGEQERGAADFRREQAAKATAYLAKQTAEKRDRDAFFNKTLYTNEPDAGYFKQFGTSHR